MIVPKYFRPQIFEYDNEEEERPDGLIVLYVYCCHRISADVEIDNNNSRIGGVEKEPH